MILVALMCEFEDIASCCWTTVMGHYCPTFYKLDCSSVINAVQRTIKSLYFSRWALRLVVAMGKMLL